MLFLRGIMLRVMPGVIKNFWGPGAERCNLFCIFGALAADATPIALWGVLVRVPRPRRANNAHSTAGLKNVFCITLWDPAPHPSHFLALPDHAIRGEGGRRATVRHHMMA